MMPRRFSALRAHATLLVLAAALPVVSDLGAQSVALPPGSVTGTVSATTAKGDVVAAPNVVVQLWATDALTEAKRDSACATWLANKTIWMQAKGEQESPSGINWSGTAVGHDLDLLNSLMALRRDTTHTDASGAFSFHNVPPGAYTVEAEVYANDKFLQWSRDIAVLPDQMLQTALDKTTLAENQYCPMPSPPAGPAAKPGARKSER